MYGVTFHGGEVDDMFCPVLAAIVASGMVAEPRKNPQRLLGVCDKPPTGAFPKFGSVGTTVVVRYFVLMRVGSAKSALLLNGMMNLLTLALAEVNGSGRGDGTSDA